MKIRLDKMLSHLGFGSRKEVKNLLKKQQLTINGQRVKEGKYIVETDVDLVELEDEKLVYEQYVYFMLHKPKGVISATEDYQHRTVLDLLREDDRRKDLFPVGRLDKDTTGLLLLTNDGSLAHELLSPKKEVAKCYHALVQGLVTQKEIALFEEGFMIVGHEMVKPSQLTIEEVNHEKEQSKIRLVISEGKYHQVKRMFETVGMEVIQLHRATMGPLKLDKELIIGDYRPLTETELMALK